MLLLKFILFACYVVGSYCMSYKCNKQGMVECKEYIMEKLEMPNTIEDVRNYCTKRIPLGKCMNGVLERCARNESFPDREEDLDNWRRIEKFIEESCDEDSQVFKAITGNLQCVRSTFDSNYDHCNWLGRNNTFKEEVENMISADPRVCAWDALTFHCNMARYDVECGTEVRDAVSEIFSNINWLPGCEDARRELQYFEDAFKAEFERGKSGRDAQLAALEVIRKKQE